MEQLTFLEVKIFHNWYGRDAQTQLFLQKALSSVIEKCLLDTLQLKLFARTPLRAI